MIRNALSVLPTRPILYIVPIIVVLVMSFYYGDIYAKCSNNKQFRTSLNELLGSGDRPRQFRLMDFADFTWDRVRIVTDFKPEGKSVECPLGWNWSNEERDSLISSGLLTVLIFVQQGIIVDVLELRGDEVAFRGTDNSSLTPQAAVFSVRNNGFSGNGVTLTLKDQ